MKKKQIQREKFIATAKPSLGTYATRSRHLSGGREPGATEQPDSGRMIHLGKQEQAPPAPQQPGLQVTLPHGTEHPGAALRPGGIWGVSVAWDRNRQFWGVLPPKQAAGGRLRSLRLGGLRAGAAGQDGTPWGWGATQEPVPTQRAGGTQGVPGLVVVLRACREMLPFAARPKGAAAAPDGHAGTQALLPPHTLLPPCVPPTPCCHPTPRCHPMSFCNPTATPLPPHIKPAAGPLRTNFGALPAPRPGQKLPPEPPQPPPHPPQTSPQP